MFCEREPRGRGRFEFPILQEVTTVWFSSLSMRLVNTEETLARLRANPLPKLTVEDFGVALVSTSWSFSLEKPPLLGNDSLWKASCQDMLMFAVGNLGINDDYLST